MQLITRQRHLPRLPLSITCDVYANGGWKDPFPSPGSKQPWFHPFRSDSPLDCVILCWSETGKRRHEGFVLFAFYLLNKQTIPSCFSHGLLLTELIFKFSKHLQWVIIKNKFPLDLLQFWFFVGNCECPCMTRGKVNRHKNGLGGRGECCVGHK